MARPSRAPHLLGATPYVSPPAEDWGGKKCSFGRGCKKLDCSDDHPQGRECDDNPDVLICRFGRKCKRAKCFYTHPDGKGIDEKPEDSLCKRGIDCTHPGCIFTHPERPPHVEELKCHVPVSTPAAGSSGKKCSFGRRCRKLDCSDDHPEGREFEDNPDILICSFGRKCKRAKCFYTHPEAREIDEKPEDSLCKRGVDCTRRGCIFSHPEGHNAEELKCHNCKGVGHLSRDCTQQKGCGICGEFGHLQKACPTLPEPCCRICGEPGHNQKTCPASLCLICQKYGHIQNNCPTVKSTAPTEAHIAFTEWSRLQRSSRSRSRNGREHARKGPWYPPAPAAGGQSPGGPWYPAPAAGGTWEDESDDEEVWSGVDDDKKKSIAGTPVPVVRQPEPRFDAWALL